eukprot:1529102-Rhodomonas_salina.3
MSSWADPRDEFRTVIREIQHLRARRHCMDAHRLYQMWRGIKLPSRLFLRASRLCDIEPPTGLSWMQTEHVRYRLSLDPWMRLAATLAEREFGVHSRLFHLV